MPNIISLVIPKIIIYFFTLFCLNIFWYSSTCLFGLQILKRFDFLKYFVFSPLFHSLSRFFEICEFLFSYFGRRRDAGIIGTFDNLWFWKLEIKKKLKECWKVKFQIQCYLYTYQLTMEKMWKIEEIKIAIIFCHLQLIMPLKSFTFKKL